MKKTWCLSLIAALALLLTVGPALAAGAPGPQQTVKTTVNKVLDILRDKALKNDDAARRDKLWQVISNSFEDQDITRRVMAAEWKKLTEAQKAKITELFTHLLKKSYLTKLETYSGQEVIFTKEYLDGDYAEVESQIQLNNDKVPLSYRLVKKGDKWLIYDVIIDRVSLVSNYKRLFRNTIRKKGLDGLIKALEAKMDQVETLDKKN